MQISSRFRSVAVAAIAAAGVSIASAAHADSGTIRFSVYKAAFFIGGSGGEGTLTFHGKRYPISVGGVSGGLAFGASKTYFQGTVRRIRRASDVTGVYGAAGGGGAEFRFSVLCQRKSGKPEADRSEDLQRQEYLSGRSDPGKAVRDHRA